MLWQCRVKSQTHGPLSTQGSLLPSREPGATGPKLPTQMSLGLQTAACDQGEGDSPPGCAEAAVGHMGWRAVVGGGGLSVDSRWGCAPQTGAVTCCVAADKSQNTSDCRLLMHELKQHAPQMTTEKRCNNRCESTWSAVELPHEYEILRYNVNLCYRPKW